MVRDGGPPASAETSLRAALDLIDVSGDAARGLPFERRLRDAVGGRLYSGTSELMRRIVAREMGL